MAYISMEHVWTGKDAHGSIDDYAEGFPVCAVCSLSKPMAEYLEQDCLRPEPEDVTAWVDPVC